MSAITSDWAPMETEAATRHAAGDRNEFRREWEFRSALNNYVAGYIADQQKRRAAATGSIR